MTMLSLGVNLINASHQVV